MPRVELNATTLVQRALATEGVLAIVAGGALNLDVAGKSRLTVIPTSGGTATISKVDSVDATEHDVNTDFTTTTELTIDIEWPFYRVSLATQGARVASV